MANSSIISKREARMTIVLAILVTVGLCPSSLVILQALKDNFNYSPSPGGILDLATQQCRIHIAASLMVPIIYLFYPVIAIVYINRVANTQRLVRVTSANLYYGYLFLILICSVLVPVPLGLILVSSLGYLIFGTSAFFIETFSIEEWIEALLPQAIISASIIVGLPLLSRKVMRLLLKSRQVKRSGK